ncbi:MAG: WYL domain-containing protein [Oscillospiraceae bacterium]|nr:WYL domain-containing protein [Oscillospiraceae bacterium]
MPRSSNQKLKPLYLARILLERTDESNVMTAQDIIAALAAYDVPADRKSIYDDIDALRQYGMDIELIRGKNGGYYVASRDFELPELKLLVDAALSSRLITGKKSNMLIKKLSKLTSQEQAKQLNRQVHMQGRAKTLNETVYYAVDAIHAAINTNQKISFRYFSYDMSKKRVYAKEDKRYIRTPVAMCWNEDNYYLVAYSSSYEKPFGTFRVDRMTDVEVLAEKADKFDKAAFSISDYIKQNFGMFTGETIAAKLSFDASLVSVVLDQFGADTHLIKTSDSRFTVNVNVSETPVFLGWMFKFAGKAEILEPQSLRDAMMEMLKAACEMYGDSL